MWESRTHSCTPNWGARIANAMHPWEIGIFALKIHGHKTFLDTSISWTSTWIFFVHKGFFWGISSSFTPSELQPDKPKMTPAVCSEIPPRISNTMFWYPWPKSSNFEGCVCVASRFPPSDFLKLWYGICLGKITTRRFHWFLVVLKTKHSKNMGFSSKRPFQMLIRRNFQHQNILKQESPPRSFLFQKLWVRQVGPKNITTKNQKPVEIWQLEPWTEMSVDAMMWWHLEVISEKD